MRKFNEQANEEAGDHFTPREVIRLMVNLVFTSEQDIYKKQIYKSIYDPTAGTGGMLSVSQEFIQEQNSDAHIELFGQEYNPEAYAICCSDLLIKDESIDNLVYGDTLGIKNAKRLTGNFVPHDGHPARQFHYMFANPPFGVEWKPEKNFVEEECTEQGFNGIPLNRHFYGYQPPRALGEIEADIKALESGIYAVSPKAGESNVLNSRLTSLARNLMQTHQNSITWVWNILNLGAVSRLTMRVRVAKE